MRFYTVHSGGPVNLMGEEELGRYMTNRPAGEVITDRAAQTIASLWHSAGSPLSTRLSTMGKVDRFLTVEDFCPEHEMHVREEQGDSAMEELRALQAYIKYHVAVAPSGYLPCSCDDCPALTIGKVGEICAECEEAGCDNQGSECSRENAYGDGVDMIDACD